MKEFIAAGICEVEVTDEESVRRLAGGALCLEAESNRCFAKRYVEVQSSPAGEFFKRVALQRLW